MSRKITVLFKLYKYIGSLLCDELGHDWEKARFEPHEGNGWASWDSGHFEKCRRCGDTRSNLLIDSSTSSSSTVTFDTTETGNLTITDD